MLVVAIPQLKAMMVAATEARIRELRCACSAADG